MNHQQQRPFPVVTPVAGKVVPDSMKAEMHRKPAQPATMGQREDR